MSDQLLSERGRDADQFHAVLDQFVDDLGQLIDGVLVLLGRLCRGNACLDGANGVPGGDFAQLRENCGDLRIKHSTRTVDGTADIIAAVASGATVPKALYAGAPVGRGPGSFPPRPSSMPIAVDGGLI